MEFKDPKKIANLDALALDVDAKSTRHGRRETDMTEEDKKNELEAVYTSTPTKLLQHMDRLQDAQNGVWRPINLQIAPTDKCNLECRFCSVYRRDGDTIPIDNLKRCIDDFLEVGPIKSVEVTGGGDPTLYPHLTELISYLAEREVSIGMITNGILLHRVPQETLDKLTWLRVSLSFLDKENYYPGAKPKDIISIPKIKGDLGLSYVWNINSSDFPDLTELLFSAEDKFRRIQEIAKETNPKFIRIVPDCHNPEEQKFFKEKIAPHVQKYNVAFPQSKEYDVHYACRIGYLKPFLNADGYLYHCSASPLYKGKFEKEWRIGHMSQVKELWPSNLPKMDTTNCYAGKCFYAQQNRFLHSLEVKVPHSDFM